MLHGKGKRRFFCPNVLTPIVPYEEIGFSVIMKSRGEKGCGSSRYEARWAIQVKKWKSPVVKEMSVKWLYLVKLVQT